MDDADRTAMEPVEVPAHLLPYLREAAEDAFERACDNSGEWDDEIRTRALDAARVVEVFDVDCLTPTQIADLADRALRLPFEEQLKAPESKEDLMALVGLTGRCRELLTLRDAARARASRLNPPERGS
jgi:hypothetical protein